MGKRDQVILKNEGICKGFFCEKWTSNPENQEVEIEELMKLSLELKKKSSKITVLSMKYTMHEYTVYINVRKDS